MAKITNEEAFANAGIESLNEMQLTSLTTSREAANIILLSNTGSGKTLAFLLPVLESLDEKNQSTQALIIVPSRELAIQIEKVFKSLGTGFKITACYGGHLRETEENNLKEAPSVIVGTPGRLADHIRRENIKTAGIRVLILDEFDKSLEAGFEEEMSFIIGSLGSVEKRMLISATEAVEIPLFIGMKDAVRLNHLSEEAKNSLSIQFVRSDEKDKIDCLTRLIGQIGNRSSIIFCNHREAVERTASLLAEKGIVNVFYHGALEQPERETALAKFRNGSSDFLVTTDLASRGLDIAHIRYIIHYHLPLTEEAFTHRNGRTARMDASGTAIMVLGPEEHLPGYIADAAEEIQLPETFTVPKKPEWTTLFIAAGKKDKVNKVDVVGFFTNKGKLKKEDIGLIEVKDFFSFVAIRKSKVGVTIEAIKNEKIKNKKVKIDVAR